MLDPKRQRLTRVSHLVSAAPLIEVAGDRRVLVENHSGITEYGSERICIRVRYGQICVHGAGLVIARMTGEQLVICGRIDGVELRRGRESNDGQI